MNEPDGGYRRLLSRLAAPQTPPPWGLGEVGTLFLALMLAIIMIGITATMMLFGGMGGTGSYLFGWTIGLGIMIAFVLFTRRKPAGMEALKLRNPSRLPLLYVVALGLAAALTIDLVVAGAGGFHITPALNGICGDLSNSTAIMQWLLAGAFLIVVQPVAEGLIFSGVALPRLRASLGPYPGLIATAVLFTVLHAAIYGATLTGTAMMWYGIIMPLLTGLFLGAVRVYTDSTRAAILAQAGMGIVLLLAALALVSGGSNIAGCQIATMI